MNILKLLFTGCFFLSLTVAGAQPNDQKTSDPVLFKIGDETVTRSEFEYVFKKNNANAHFHEKELRDYLDLYIKFKLKVKEAEEMQIDTLPNVRNELETYRNQLLNSFVEKELIDTLLAHTYKRMEQDVKVSHILVKLDPDASPADTLKAWNTIMDIRKRLIRGENFEKVAIDKSEDPYVKQNKGDLGYFTALQIPFIDFETAAYETAIGKVSMPIRTRLGYHLIKPTDRRPAMGQVQVAHILIKTDTSWSKKQLDEAKSKADEAYGKLRSGGDWDEITAVYSDDVSNKDKGGALQPFGTGRMVAEFENAALALKKDGDFSAPIKTNYGYHIIKRINHSPIPSFGEVKEDLKKNLMQGERFTKAKESLVNKYQRNYGYIEYPQAFDEVFSLLDSTYYRGNWRVNNIESYKKPVFEIEKEKYVQEDLIRYIYDNQRKFRAGSLEAIFQNIKSQLVQESVLEYGLGIKYPEFVRLRQEYKDGIVMFDLMEKKVWAKAIEDTAGLRAYYNDHKEEYKWGPRLDVDVFTITDAKMVKKIKKKAKKSSNAELLEKYNEAGKEPVLIISSGRFEKGANPDLEKVAWQEGLTQTFSDTAKVVLVRVNKVLDPMPKTLGEARGFFIADYQDHLEQVWLADLRKRYPVTVNEEVLKSLLVPHDH